mmetsp:Transcript_21454/g.19031  ORF Transcript_21454/g.19031 Transcript_21454/m.19031 type:complete len:96 (+) Transcript_21454:2319-2606(+)|eukprot:CAMPEP_0205802796 /NCGR_PEP_ID=MMETSP0205-20121125/5251_1 /ASSEMBLY_ACC=CAM_ASM_000278 /TAXON_ID=36767 /ORGANISM="Euplotes focardii, Strain TN1" /LENGTH=95 /DNA_ID=CAMNT_0053069835 /DNA_START=2244 /DNA_END=2528 /DNA_ORIENTATION=+
MMYRLKQHKDVFKILISIGKYAKALDFAKKSAINNWVKYSELRDMIEADEDMNGRNKTFLIQRINKIKQKDDNLIHQDSLYQPFFEDARPPIVSQ